MKGWIKGFVKDKLGKFLEGLDQTEISYGVSSATLELKDVTIKPEAIEKFKLPVQIKLGMVESLFVMVPWSHISSSRVEIKLKGLNLLMTPQDSSQWDYEDIFDPQVLQNKLNQMIKDVSNEIQTETQQGYFDRIKIRVLDNLAIEIKDVHIRIEESDELFDITNLNKRASRRSLNSFGILLSNFDFQTVNLTGERHFHDRTATEENIFKRLKLQGLAVYLNSADKFQIHLKDDEDKASIQSEMNEVVKNYRAKMQAEVQSQTNNQSFTFDNSRAVNHNTDDNLNYILKPLSMNLRSDRSTKEPYKLTVDLNLKSLGLSFNHDQLKSIIKFVELAQNYKRASSMQAKQKKFKFLKPINLPGEPFQAKKMWKFAIDCVQRSLRAKRGAMNAFIIPFTKLTEIENQVKPLLRQFIEAKDCEYTQENSFLIKKIKWTPQQRALFFYALESVDKDYLKEWVKDVALSLKNKSDKKKNNQPENLDQSDQLNSSYAGTAGNYFKSLLFGKQDDQDLNKQSDDEDQFFDCEDDFPMEANELEKQVAIRDAMQVQISITIHEFVVQVGKINFQNNIDGIEVFNRGMLLTFMAPSLGKLSKEFILKTSLKEFGVSMITINRQTGRYDDYTTVVLANKETQKNQINSKIKGVTNKTEDDQPQWKIEVSKNTPELVRDGIEHDIKLEANSLMIKYMPDLILRAKMITQLKVAEKTQTEYFDRLEEVQKATQNNLIDLIYKKRNRYSIKCKSPVFVLPIEKTFDGRYSPIWVVRTGDVYLKSFEQQDLKKEVLIKTAQKFINNDSPLKSPTLMSESEYFETFDIQITSMRLHYYQSFDTYQDHLREARQDVKNQKKRDKEDRQANHIINVPQAIKQHFEKEEWAQKEVNKSKQQSLMTFCVLEDFKISMTLKLKRSLKGLVMGELQRQEYEQQPKVVIKITTTALVINLSHYIYNRLYNLKHIFTIDPAQLKQFDKDVEQTNTEKYEDVIKNMRIKGFLQVQEGGESYERQLYQNLPHVDAPSELRARKKSTLHQKRPSASQQQNTGIKTNYESAYCILSANNINFYSDENQTKPFDWFYLKSCVVKKLPGTQLELQIENLKGDFRKIKFVVEKEREKWLAEINNVLSDEMFTNNPEDNPLARSMTIRGSVYAKSRKETITGSMYSQINTLESQKNLPEEAQLGRVSKKKSKEDDKQSSGKKKPKKSAHKDIIVIKSDLTFSMPYFTVNLMKLKQTIVNGVLDIVRPAVYDEWVTFQLKEMSMWEQKRPHDEQKLLKIKEATIKDVTMVVNNVILGQAPQTGLQNEEEQKPALQVVQKKQKLLSPRYKEFNRLENLVEVQLQDILIHWYPQTVNQILKLFRAMKPQTKPVKESNLIQAAEYSQQKGFQRASKEETTDKESIKSSSNLAEFNYSSEASGGQSLQYMTDAEQSMVAGATEIQQQEYTSTCVEEDYQKDRFIIVMNNVQCNLLHPEFQMEIFRMDFSSFEMKYEAWYDHTKASMIMNQVFLYDMTSYPYTINPKNYYEMAKKVKDKNQLTKLKLQSLVEMGKMEMEMEMYQSKKCPRKPKSNSSRINMVISPMKLNYVQEVIFRFQEYFFQQFMDTLTMTDPYVDPKKDFIDPMARRKKKDLGPNTEWGQPTEIPLMDVQIKDMIIILKPRPKSPVYLLLSTPSIKVTQELYKKSGRVYAHPQIELAHQNQRTVISKLAFHYCKGSPKGKVNTKYDQKLSLLQHPFDIKIDFEKMSYAKVIDECHHTALKKSANVNITFEPVLFVWPQKVYTFLLSCMDLNTAWSDQMRKEYYFIKWVEMEDMYRQYPDVVDKHIKMIMPTVSLTMRHSDSSLLAELVLQTMEYELDMYLDGCKKGQVFCKDFYILQQSQDQELQEERKFFDAARGSQARPRASSINKRGRQDNAKIPISTDQNIPKIVIVGPLNSPGEITIKQIVAIGQQRKGIKLQPDECQYHQTIDMRPTGQKEFELTIRKLKIFMKPQVFMMVKAFFMNSFPKYTKDSKDKPLGFNDNPENAPKMISKTKIRNSLICFYNRPGYKSIACEGSIDFDMHRGCIVKKKQKIEKRIAEKQRRQSIRLERDEKEKKQRQDIIDEQAQQRKDIVVDFFSKEYQPDIDMDFDLGSSVRNPTQAEISENPEALGQAKSMVEIENGPTQEQVYQTTLKVKKFSPFMCSVNYLIEGKKNFGDIKKRQLLQPFNFTQDSVFELFQYMTQPEKNLLEKSFDTKTQTKYWGVQNTVKTNMTKTLCKMSIQDAHLIFQLIAFMAETLTKDLVDKLKQIFNQINWNESRIEARKKQQNLRNSRRMSSSMAMSAITEERDDDSKMNYQESSDDKSSHDSEDNDALFNQDLIIVKSHDSRPQFSKRLDSSQSEVDVKEILDKNGNKLTPLQKAQMCLDEDDVDVDLIECLNQILDEKFDASMKMQMTRLTSIQGLFGKLTEEYCTQQLKSRTKFNTFILEILTSILELKKETKKQNDDDYFFQPSENDTSFQQSETSDEEIRASDKCFEVGFEYDKEVKESEPQDLQPPPQQRPRKPTLNAFGNLITSTEQLKRRNTGAFASDSSIISKTIQSKSTQGLNFGKEKLQSINLSQRKHSAKHSNKSSSKSNQKGGPDSFYTAESGQHSGDSDEFESAQMEDSDEDFMSAEEDLPPNKLTNDASQPPNSYGSQNELLIDSSRRASSLDRKIIMEQDRDLVKVRKVVKTRISQNVRLSNQAFNSMVGRVRTSFIGTQHSARNSNASASVQQMLKKKKKLLQKKRSCIENVRVLKSEMVSEGFEILFINDYDRQFSPVLEFTISDILQTHETSKFYTEAQDGSRSQHSEVVSEMRLNEMSSEYYNIELGKWEPFLEQMTIQTEQMEDKDSVNFSLLLPNDTNLNITESCMRNLILTYQSWMEMPNFLEDKVKGKQAKKELIKVIQDEKQSELIAKQGIVSQQNNPFQNFKAPKSKTEQAQLRDSLLNKSSSSDEESPKKEDQRNVSIGTAQQIASNRHLQDMLRDSNTKNMKMNPIKFEKNIFPSNSPAFGQSSDQAIYVPQAEETEQEQEERKAYIEEVAPFSLVNYSDMNLVIVQDGLDDKKDTNRFSTTLHESQMNRETEIQEDSFYVPRGIKKQLGSDPKAKSKKYYKLHPGDTKDYNVPYESLMREQNQRQRQKIKSKRKGGRDRTSSEVHIVDYVSDTASQITDSDRRMSMNSFIEEEESKEKDVNNEHMSLFKKNPVGIYFNKYNTVKNVDLNDLSFDNPFIHNLKTKDQLRKEEQSSKGGSKKKSLGEIDQQTFRQSADLEDPLLGSNDKSQINKKKKRLPRFANLSEKDQEQLHLFKNILLYGVVLRKMRKELVIRTSCVFHNKTPYAQEMLILPNDSFDVAARFIIRPDQSYPLSLKFYKRHTIRVKIVKNSQVFMDNLTENRMKDDKEFKDKIQLGASQEIKNSAQEIITVDELDTYSQPVFMESLLKLGLNSGQGYFLTNRNQRKLSKKSSKTYSEKKGQLFAVVIKRQSGELVGCSDFVLLPTLSIKNCLPCFIQVKQHIQEEQNKVFDSQDNQSEQKLYRIEKAEEKSFFVFTELQNKPGEMQIQLHVDGFQQQNIILNMKDQRQSNNEDIDIIIKDKDDNPLKIAMKIQMHKAGFHLTLSAHALILIEARQLMHMGFMHLYYCSAYLKNTEGMIAGCSEAYKRGYVMLNKVDAIKVAISPDTTNHESQKFYSDALEIKQTGIIQDFQIATQNVSKVNITRARAIERSTNRVEKTLNSVDQKFNFAISAHLHLCDVSDSIYTKVISISPKYVLVNQAQCALEISQKNCEDIFSKNLGIGQRMEWNWQNNIDIDHLIVIRKATQQHDMSEEGFFGTLPTLDQSQQNKLLDPLEEQSSSSDGISDKNPFSDQGSYSETPKRIQLKENLDRIKAQKEHQRDWFYSSGFQIDDEQFEQMTIMIREDTSHNIERQKHIGQNEPPKQKIIRISKKIINDTTFIIFEEENEQAPMYQIINDCCNVSLNYQQIMTQQTMTQQFENDSLSVLSMRRPQTRSSFTSDTKKMFEDQLGPGEHTLVSFEYPQLKPLKMKIQLQIDTHENQTDEKDEYELTNPKKKVPEFMKEFKKGARMQEMQVEVTFNDKNGITGIEQRVIDLNSQSQLNQDQEERQLNKDKVVLTYKDQNNQDRKIIAKFYNDGITKTVSFVPDIQDFLDSIENKQYSGRQESGLIQNDYLMAPLGNENLQGLSAMPLNINHSDVALPKSQQLTSIIEEPSNLGSRVQEERKRSNTDSDDSQDDEVRFDEPEFRTQSNQLNESIRMKAKKKGSESEKQKQTTFQVKVSQINLSIVGGSFYDLNKKQTKGKDASDQQFENNPLLQDQVNVRTMINNRKELALINICGLEYEKINFPERTEKDVKILGKQHIHFHIAHFQMDDQSVLNPLYPTIMQPKPYRTFGHRQRNFLDVRMELEEKPKVLFVNNFSCTLAETTVTMADDFMLNVAFLMIRIQKLRNSTFTTIHPVFLKGSFYDDLSDIFPTEPTMRGLPNPLTMSSMSQNQFVQPKPSFQKSTARNQKRQDKKADSKKALFGVHLNNHMVCTSTAKEVEPQFRRWVNQDVNDFSTTLVLKNFKIEEIRLEITFSFKTRHAGTEKSIQALGPLAYLKKTGFTLLNIDEHRLHLPRFECEQNVVSQDNLSAQLGAIYKESLISQMSHGAFSVVAFGQPAFMYHNIQTGMRDFMTKPVEGFKNGPLAGFRGFGSGTISLTKNISVGLIQTFQSLGKGISQLAIAVTTDRDYAREREDNSLTEKPKDFVEGFGYGSIAAINGLKAGIFDFFYKPYVEVSRKGPKGIGRGTWIAVTGTFCKPISGACDFTSKVFEGLKNTLLVFERKQTFSRSRQPRPFYGRKRVIKRFDDSHALIICGLLFELQMGEFQNDHFLEVKLIHPYMLLLTEEHLMLIEIKQKVLVWSILTQKIAGTTKLQNGMLIWLSGSKQSDRKYVGVPLEFDADDDSLTQWIETIANEFQ